MTDFAASAVSGAIIYGGLVVVSLASTGHWPEQHILLGSSIGGGAVPLLLAMDSILETARMICSHVVNVANSPILTIRDLLSNLKATASRWIGSVAGLRQRDSESD